MNLARLTNEELERYVYLHKGKDPLMNRIHDFIVNRLGVEEEVLREACDECIQQIITDEGDYSRVPVY